MPTASAFWPFSHKPPAAEKPYTGPQPEAPDASIPDTQCEPLRIEIVRLRQDQGWLFNPVAEIKIAHLTRKHRKCLDSFRDKEYEFLKHADPLPDTPIFPKGM